MEKMTLRPMKASDRWEIAELICISTNVWYQTQGRSKIFPGGPETTAVYFDVYEAMDPGCGIVAVSNQTGRLAGSCFVHPRPTHVSLGIMNVHPNHFGSGVARQLLGRIIEFADSQQKPLRLVSSALNLDSFSLYTRTGFVPQTAYQDMFIKVPEEGLSYQTDGDRFVKNATPEDIADMVALEMEIAGLNRELDYRHFIRNQEGFWHLSVYRDAKGVLQGFMASSAHPGCNMIGPGSAREPSVIASLLLAELNRHPNRSPVFLVPVSCGPLVAQMYQWGAKNCETHFSQVRGPSQPLKGIQMPTFLPESC